MSCASTADCTDCKPPDRLVIACCAPGSAWSAPAASVLTLDFPENVATFRATILDLQTLMNDGVSTVVLQTNKTSTTLNLSLLCDGYSANDKVVLRHIGSRACLTVKGRSRRDLLIGR